jgi:hypothetical protein
LELLEQPFGALKTFPPLKSKILSMADGYLESRYDEYERRKAAWLKKKKKIQPRPLTPKPEDEAL